MKTTSSASANTSTTAAAESQNRNLKLNYIRTLIRQENFTAEELLLPQTFDLISLFAAIRSCPVKLSSSKLIILTALFSHPFTRQDLYLITGADQTTISHNLTDLLDQGFITKHRRTPANTSTYSLTPNGITIVQTFHLHYFKTLDAITAASRKYKN